MLASGSVVLFSMPKSRLEYCSGLSLANRSALPRQRLAQSNLELRNFPKVSDGQLCSVMPAWQGSVLPCRCLSLCLHSMRLGQLTRQRQAFSPGRFWPGSRARSFCGLPPAFAMMNRSHPASEAHVSYRTQSYRVHVSVPVAVLSAILFLSGIGALIFETQPATARGACQRPFAVEPSGTLPDPVEEGLGLFEPPARDRRLDLDREREEHPGLLDAAVTVRAHGAARLLEGLRGAVERELEQAQPGARDPDRVRRPRPLRQPPSLGGAAARLGRVAEMRVEDGGRAESGHHLRRPLALHGEAEELVRQLKRSEE